MNVGNALKVTCVGLAGGILLRTVEMLYFMDYETGFYTDSGLMAWTCTGFVLLACLIAAILCGRANRSYGVFVPRRNPVTGVVAVLSGIALLASGVIQASRYLDGSYAKGSEYGMAERGFMHAAFFVLCLLFGLVQLYAGVGFFAGKNYFAKLPLLYLVSVLWGIFYLGLVYMFYAKSSSYSENLFAVLEAASLLLSLMYLTRVFAGIGKESSTRRLFVCGVCASVLTLSYGGGNLLLLLFGKQYPGEIPSDIQIAVLCVGVFLLLFLITFRKYGIRKLTAAEEKPRHRATRFRQSEE